MVSDFDFLNNIWPQNCGDSLKVIGKSEHKDKYGHLLWKCQFIKYPYEIYEIKNHILNKNVDNPRIEQVEFIEKVWPQHCGDSLRILNKILISQRGKNSLFECEFQKYPNKILARKAEILKGKVRNLKMPWWDKENLIKYIQENFKEKPTLRSLSNSLNISYSFLNNQINSFGLSDSIDYDSLKEENQVINFIKSIYQGPTKRYCGTKEENYLEIDIYFPELKRGIEYNGSLWHEEGNLNNKFTKPKGYHQNKKDIFAKKGIDILFIWDYEWFEDFPKRKIINEQTKQKISNFILN